VDVTSLEPSLFIVMGGTGDLMQRKLLPALFRLVSQGDFGQPCQILGVSRSRSMNDASFRSWARAALDAATGSGPAERDEWCDKCLHYQSIGDGGAADYAALADRIVRIERDKALPGNRTFYLALPPGSFPGTIEGLGEAGLASGPGWTRVVIEKPFGRDLESARDLNSTVHRYFDEPQVYRIDHYLGKETVQNLLVLRFANPLFESHWNRDSVESVQITVAEDLGIEERAGYYDRSGALRDMIQNHMTQLLSLVAMEVPVCFDADAIRDEKVKVLRSVAPIDPDGVVFGQYGPGEADGVSVRGYADEDGVASGSRTETFAALRLDIDNWRWQGVPFYLRTGKRLPRRTTQIVVRFRRAPVSLFERFGPCHVHKNELIITLQPDEGFDLRFEVKRPGEPFALTTHTLDFTYGEAYLALADAYETLLRDVLTGDQTLFVRADEVEAAWRLYTPLLEGSRNTFEYAAGDWGPPEAEDIFTPAEWTVL
jgi:glucose-6-phosphate 1-dehydrogenase